MIKTVEKTAEQIAEVQDKNNIQAASKEIMETEIQKVILYKKFTHTFERRRALTI